MTIKDIATRLGVSVSTVSKALNNATDISPATKKKVLDFANSEEFALKKKRTNPKRLCVFFEDMGHSSEQIGYDILSGFKSMAENENYEVIIKSTTHDNTAIDYDAIMTQDNLLGGFVLGANLNSSLHRQLNSTRFPTIVMDNFIDNAKVSSIGVDNINTVTLMVDYLVGLGHRRIGMLSGEKKSVVSRERLSGYICGLLNNDIPFDESLVKFGDFSQSCAETFADSFIAEKVSAVVCACDLTALGLINAFKRRGICVPDDISVTGYDDIELSQYVTPSITTIKQDFLSIGKNAFSMLRQMLKGSSPERVILNGSLVVRQSAAPVKHRS